MDPQEPVEPNRKRRLLSAILILFLIFILVGIAFPGHGPKKHGYHLGSWNQMHQIAVSLELYRRDHQGELPCTLSGLVPDYVYGPRIFFFQSRYTTSILPADATPGSQLIDAFSPYSFCELADKRALVSERPGMWLDGTLAYHLLDNQMHVVGTLESCTVTPDEFEMRVLRQFQ